MNGLSYPPVSDEEIFRHCKRQCGVITATEDQQFFALKCLLCAEKFLYFDAFIGHMQTVHIGFGHKEIFADMNMFEDGSFPEINSGDSTGMPDRGVQCAGANEDEELADAALIEPPMVMIKEELVDEDAQCDNDFTPQLRDMQSCASVEDPLFALKEEEPDGEENMEASDQNYLYNYDEYSGDDARNGAAVEEESPEDEDANYDDLVEESLLGGSGLTIHIKDRKMIKFLIDSYRRNPFLWDHCHVQFRDRFKRQQFLDWIMMEFKRRFNITLAKDAVTRKWDNLRTVYKRECNRMAQEKTNVSTLWYFVELNFLHRFYGGNNQKISDTVIKDAVYRRRYSALWNDVSTSKLLQMVEYYPCFYDKINIDYRSKEKRGEALQLMAAELQKMVDVTTIQISKRISQLRFDYSKQKQERLQCEQNNKMFIPTYTYYEQMLFMDADVAPFKCDYCPIIVQTPREMDAHLLIHRPNNSSLVCPVCHMAFQDVDELNRHKQLHEIFNNSSGNDQGKKYHCDLCTASFRARSNYDEHMRRHNDELLLPALSGTGTAEVRGGVASGSSPAIESKPLICEVCGKAFAQQSLLNSHKALHTPQHRNFKCDYPHCGRTFTARQSMTEHMKLHYNDDEYRCDICGKGFRSTKNLQNHKQIHDAVKKYICKICGSAFAQAAGLYLHKRRHNRQTERSRLNR